MYRNVVTEMSPDQRGQTEMSRDRNGPDWNGSDRNGQTESAKLKRPDRIGQTERSCSAQNPGLGAADLKYDRHGSCHGRHFDVAQEFAWQKLWLAVFSTRFCAQHNR